MSNTPLPSVDPLGYIRTYVMLAIGSLLGYLIATYTWVANLVAFLDSTLPAELNVEKLLNVIVIAAVTALYYWVARQLGRRWPAAEKWLLGSSAKPAYLVGTRTGVSK